MINTNSAAAAASYPSSLEGARVLVIGLGGIGTEIARTAHRAGAELVLAGRDPGSLDGLANQLGGAEHDAVNLQEEESLRRLASTIGPVDHIVSTAGAPAMGPVSDLGLSEIERAFAMKAIGPLLVAKHLGANLPAGGSLTFLSGYVAWRPQRGLAVMAATNGALAFLAPALAVELGPVRVNVVSPGVIDSGMWDGPDKQRIFAEHAGSSPVGRIGRTEDVASAVVFLMRNTFVTGTVLHVDGGARYAS